LKDELAGLQRDFVAEGFEQSGQTAEVIEMPAQSGHQGRAIS